MEKSATEQMAAAIARRSRFMRPATARPAVPTAPTRALVVEVLLEPEPEPIEVLLDAKAEMAAAAQDAARLRAIAIQWLGHPDQQVRSSCPRIAEIVSFVAKRMGVTVALLKSERRTHNVVQPRQIAMWLAKRHTVQSLPEIGRRMGGRDHTTVLHAFRKIEKEIDKQTDLGRLALTVEADFLMWSEERA